MENKNLKEYFANFLKEMRDFPGFEPEPPSIEERIFYFCARVVFFSIFAIGFIPMVFAAGLIAAILHLMNLAGEFIYPD